MKPKWREGGGPHETAELRGLSEREALFKSRTSTGSGSKTPESPGRRCGWSGECLVVGGSVGCGGSASWCSHCGTCSGILLTIQPEIPTNLSRAAGRRAEMDRHASPSARAPGSTKCGLRTRIAQKSASGGQARLYHRRPPGHHEDTITSGKMTWLWMHWDLWKKTDLKGTWDHPTSVTFQKRQNWSPGIETRWGLLGAGNGKSWLQREISGVTGPSLCWLWHWHNWMHLLLRTVQWKGWISLM